MAKKRMDPDTEAALEVVEMEKKKEELARVEQQTRERLIAQSHEMAGQIKTAVMFSKFGDVSRLVWLKQVKETQIYKAIGTWDNYCEYIGLDRRTVDENLQNLATFGQDFLATVASLNVGYRELRKLRQLTHDGSVVVAAEYVTIGEEKIPLDPDHTEDLQAAIESLLESRDRQIEEQQATLRAKDRRLGDKEKDIQKLHKDLAKFEARAETLGYTPGEEALMQKLDNARTTIDGFLMQFDPEKNPLPEDATPRMKAKLMHTLDYFRRVVLAAFDIAAEVYGEPEIDDDWVPPHQRPKTEAGG